MEGSFGSFTWASDNLLGSSALTLSRKSQPRRNVDVSHGAWDHSSRDRLPPAGRAGLTGIACRSGSVGLARGLRLIGGLFRSRILHPVRRSLFIGRFRLRFPLSCGVGKGAGRRRCHLTGWRHVRRRSLFRRRSDRFSLVIITAAIAADGIGPIGIASAGTGHVAAIINHDVGHIGLTRVVLKHRKEAARCQA